MKKYWTGLLIWQSCLHAAPAITAFQVIERMRKDTGLTWRADTVDTIKAGDPETPVTGIATTFAATLDVLKRASASGKNLIIAHEPTFYNHQDSRVGLENDEVAAAKEAFIKEHHMVVFRFHDYWHARRPDGILLGMIKAFGWEKFQLADRPNMFVVPETTLADLAHSLKEKLQIRTARYVGDPAMKISRIALMPGAAGAPSQLRTLQNKDVDVLVIGETSEWTTVEYVRDAVTAGKKKGLIVLGHVPSEEMGMEECARWLRGLIPEIPVSYVPAGEPFRIP